ncbi:hypothetical protein GCM10020254_07930 [Streptomyces goshikiensis]
MVLTLKAKEGFEDDNPFQVGQTGLIGNPAASHALDHGDTLLMLGTDFPYRDWYPKDCKVVQIDTREEHLGRRVPVDVGLAGDVGATLRALLPLLKEPEAPRPRAPGRRPGAVREVGGGPAAPGRPRARAPLDRQAARGAGQP